MSRITLSKPAPPTLEIKPAPFAHARRWRSPYESNGARSWPNIFMTREAFRQVNRHAASQLDLEVGGMLIGEAFVTPDKEMAIRVDGQLAARHVEHSAAHLTFTSKTLADILDRLEAEHLGKQIVGWYHTHPGLSIFLSSMDVWLHSHFFPQPWHVALVIDPYVHHGGYFYYAGGAMDFIHPKHYAGFYELVKPGQASWVTWYNLAKELPDDPEAVSSGNDPAREDYWNES